MGSAYSKTWMLFESGHGVSVDLTLHMAAGGKSRPIDAYLVTEYEGEFTRAARRAAEAVYHAAGAMGRETAAMVVGYDLQGLSVGIPIAGESGGLAFAIALAKQLFDTDPGPVAATGEVRSGHEGGPVGPVLGIDAKLTAAGKLLPGDGWILYPRENEPDIPGELRDSLTAAGLKLLPVSSVTEAISALFPALPHTDAKASGTGSRYPRALALVAVLLALGGALGYWSWQKQTDSPVPVVVTAKIKEPAGAIEKPDVETASLAPGASRKAAEGTGAAPSDAGVTVTLNGRGVVADRLAALVAKRLKRDLATVANADAAKLEIAGQLGVAWAEEARLKGSDTLNSRMALTSTTLTLKANGAEYALVLPELMVATAGSVQDLLPEAADRISQAVMERLFRRRAMLGLQVPEPARRHRDRGTDTGFE